MNYITTNSFWTFKLWIVNSQSAVISNPMTTVQTITNSAKMNDREIFGQAVWLSFAKAKEKQPDTQANASCFTFAFAHRTRKPTAIVTFD
jgi:hypothetical protein